jgi:hypothetical protein
MATTAAEDVNIQSPQMGQSHSVARSTQRWVVTHAMDMQTLHFCEACQSSELPVSF